MGRRVPGVGRVQKRAPLRDICIWEDPEASVPKGDTYLRSADCNVIDEETNGRKDRDAAA